MTYHPELIKRLRVHFRMYKPYVSDADVLRATEGTVGRAWISLRLVLGDLWRTVRTAWSVS